MSILAWLKNELSIIEDDVAPAITVLEDDLPGIIISAIEAFLPALEGETPYGVVLKTVGVLVESQGIKAGVSAIQAAVNKAESNLIKAGTPAPITLAAAAQAAAATPLPVDNVAVIAAQTVINSAVTTASNASST